MMRFATPWRVAVIALWTLAAAIVASSGLRDFAARASAPEAPLRTYLAAVMGEDLDAALLEIAPAARAKAAPFVAEQLGNGYRVLGIGVRQPSLLDRLFGRARSPDAALITVQLDVMLHTGETWRTTTHVRVVREPDGWYLARPPLQPDPSQGS